MSFSPEGQPPHQPSPVPDRVQASREIELRAKGALAAIAAAKANDSASSGKRRRSKQQAQLWELARAQTAAFFGTLVQNQLFQTVVYPYAPNTASPPFPQRNTAQVIADLEFAQSLLSAEMLSLLNATGYKPPPPAYELILDTSDAVVRAIGAYDPKNYVPYYLKSDYEEAVKKLQTLHRRLVELRGTSIMKVRRETSRLYMSVAAIGAGLSLIAPAVIEKPVQEVVKQVVQYEIKQLPGLEGVQFDGGKKGADHTVEQENFVALHTEP
jgi:hypothetical protein